MDYKKAGVDIERKERAMEGFLYWVGQTLEGRDVSLEIGYFANVVKLGSMGIAISTDGVGTKLLVAQTMGKYDTVGIDCVAMNVNDIICVGAEPVCMVDYIALEEAREDLLEEIGKGLYEGARQAEIAIVGGETAQIGEMLRGQRKGYAFDLAGCALGVVDLENIIYGQNIEEGDIILGLESSGIHSNGLTLARRVLLKDGLSVFTYSKELGRTIGEELLEPTRIYVKVIKEMLKENLAIKGLINITGGGFLNLLRVKSSVGFEIEYLPPPPPIFSLIQKEGNITDEEMYKVFNMGVGFCVILGRSEAFPNDISRAQEICQKHGIKSFVLGKAKKGEKEIALRPLNLILK